MGVRCSLPALMGPSPQTAPTWGSRSRRLIQAASSAQRRDLRPESGAGGPSLGQGPQARAGRPLALGWRCPSTASLSFSSSYFAFAVNASLFSWLPRSLRKPLKIAWSF